jgi:hypothetical protein
MQSKIRRKNFPVRPPSRIRRDPVRVPTEAELKQAEVNKRERERWGAISGLALFGAGIAAAAIAIGAMTYSSYDPAKAAAEASRFRQCYTGVGDNCVLDGDTIYVQRENALASAGDGTVLLVFSAPTRTIRVALYGRFLAPRRRAAGRPE